MIDIFDIPKPPHQYCEKKGCFRHGLYSGRCAEHRIEELQAKVERMERSQFGVTTQEAVNALDIAEQENSDLRAKLDAVSKLPDRWHDIDLNSKGWQPAITAAECGLELERALKGDNDE